MKLKIKYENNIYLYVYVNTWIEKGNQGVREVLRETDSSIISYS